MSSARLKCIGFTDLRQRRERRRAVALAQLIATVALVLSIAVAATVVSIGIARTGAAAAPSIAAAPRISIEPPAAAMAGSRAAQLIGVARAL